MSAVGPFLDLLAKSELLDPEQFEEARAAAAEENDAESLAKKLAAANLLTDWQAAQLMAGRDSFFLGKYKLLEQVGQDDLLGGIFAAEHVAMHRRVTVRTISRDFSQGEALDQFVQDAKKIASLDHPNIAEVFNVEKDGTRLFLVIESIDGDDLQQIIASQGPLDVGLAADYIRQAAAGLEHAHDRETVHGSISPSKLCLNEQGTVKILDMGLGRLRGPDPKRQDSAREASSVDFLAPEQSLGKKEFDHRADIYSLGCTFYFLLTGQPPFPDGLIHERLMKHQSMQPTSIVDLRPEASAGVVDACEKMMAKKPEDRYQSAKEVQKALGKFAKEKRVPKRVPSKRAKAFAVPPPVRKEAAPGEPVAHGDVPVGVPVPSGLPVADRAPRKRGFLATTEGKILAVVGGIVAVLLVAVVAVIVSRSRDEKPSGAPIAGSNEGEPATTGGENEGTDPTLPGGSFTIPAWAFTRGNVKVLRDGQFADAGPVIALGEKTPVVVEYDVDFPVEADYTLSLEYASGDIRSIDVMVDGEQVATGCRMATDGFKSSQARWEESCKTKIAQGKHTIRLERSTDFPHLISLRFDSPIPFPDGWKPQIDGAVLTPPEVGPGETPIAEPAPTSSREEELAAARAVEKALVEETDKPGLEAIDPFGALGRSGTLTALVEAPAAAETRVLGNIALPPGSFVDVELLGGDKAVRGDGRFVMEFDGSSNLGQILLQTKDKAGAPQQVNVAKIAIKDQAVFFQWIPGVMPNQANNLRYCGLRICVDGESRFLPLGQPPNIDPVSFSLDKATGGTTFPVSRLPEVGDLRLEITGVEGGFPEPNFNPSSTIKLGEATNVHFSSADLPRFWFNVTFRLKGSSAIVTATANIDYEIPVSQPQVFKPMDADRFGKQLAIERGKALRLLESVPQNDKRREDYMKRLLQIDEKIGQVKNLGALYTKTKSSGCKVHFRIYTIVGGKYETTVLETR